MKMQSSNKNYISTIDIGLSGDEAKRLTEEHYLHLSIKQFNQ